MDPRTSSATTSTAAHRPTAIHLQTVASDTISPGHNPAPQLVSSNREGKQFSAQYLPDSPVVEAFGYTARSGLGGALHQQPPSLRGSQSCVALTVAAAAPGPSGLPRSTSDLATSRQEAPSQPIQLRSVQVVTRPWGQEVARAVEAIEQAVLPAAAAGLGSAAAGSRPGADAPDLAEARQDTGMRPAK